jgi:hypothetical protein
MKLLREEQERRYKAPDLLEMDRQDRDDEQRHVEEMLAFSQASTESARAEITAAGVMSELLRIKAGELSCMVEEVLEVENYVTTRAVEKQEAYMKNFKVHAAERMLIALAKVYAEVQLLLMKEERKQMFRCLRLPMWLQRTKATQEAQELDPHLPQTQLRSAQCSLLPPQETGLGEFQQMAQVHSGGGTQPNSRPGGHGRQACCADPRLRQLPKEAGLPEECVYEQRSPEGDPLQLQGGV